MATREEDATGREAVSAFAKIRSDTHWRLGAVGAQAVSGTPEWSWTVSFLFVHNERLHKRYQQRRNIHIRLNPPLARCTPGSPYAGEAFCAGYRTKCLPRLHQCFTRMPRYALSTAATLLSKALHKDVLINSTKRSTTYCVDPVYF